MKKILIIFILISSSVSAQLDTTNWYPLQIGNYWEYIDSGQYIHKSITVVGDTIIPNGNTYFRLQIEDLDYGDKYNSFRRIEDGLYVYIWTGMREYKFYDFSKNVSESWRIDSIYNRKVVKKDSVWSQLFQKNLLRMEFEDLYINTNNDTFYIERSWQQIYKGVGDAILGEWGGYIELVGAIINGQRYGTISSVEDENNIIVDEFKLFQNYPNPFNPTSKIKYSIPAVASGLSLSVTLKVYDVLGTEITILVNEEKPAGSYEVEYNASNLPSGVYFYQLNAGSFIETKKMILIK